MARCGRMLVRAAVIGAMATGGLVLVAGPERVGALWDQVRGNVNAKLDEVITDPVALRAQLRELEATYPARIAQVRADLGELNAQMAQLDRERTVSARVVEMAERDLAQLQTLIARAEAAQAEQGTASLAFDGAAGREHRIEIVLGAERFGLAQAYTRAAEINNTRAAYAARTGDVERDRGYLEQQQQRLGELLATLERERAEFQSQLWQVDRQVDSIARNERMIEVLKRRQASIDEQSRYRATSLDGLQGRIGDIRARQEAELAALAAGSGRSSYEQRAKAELDAVGAARALKEAAEQRAREATRTKVIEIRPGTGTPREAEETDGAEPGEEGRGESAAARWPD